MYSIDADYIIETRRKIHQYPEIGFELPKTIALVKSELEKMGIPYTESFGESSVVAYINPDKKHFTIGIRADMDALLIQEKNDVEYKSRIDGHMHACGHDAHTAMLLGTAKALKQIEDKISCRVMLLFQPSEEGIRSGAGELVEGGVMDEIDIIIGVHIENWLDSGKIGVCKGESMASSRSLKLEFFGATAHATLPHTGHDALAAAVGAYTGIQSLLSRRTDPFSKFVCSIGKLEGGTTQNVVADYAYMLGTIRTFDMKVDKMLIENIEEIANRSAANFDCTAKLTTELKAFVLYNNPYISNLVIESAKKAVGDANISKMPIKMSSEDFSQYLTKKPGVFVRLGTRNEAKGINTLPHNNDFMLDEDALKNGSATCVQFVLDNMNGIDMEKVYASDERKI